MVQSADLVQPAPLQRLRWRTVSRGVQLVQTSQPQPGSDLATTCVRCVAAHSFAPGGITAAGDSESALLLFRICLTHALRKLTINALARKPILPYSERRRPRAHLPTHRA